MIQNKLLRLARERRGVSQSELARIAGVSRSTIVRLERDLSYAVIPSVRKAVSDALGISLAEVFPRHAEDD